MFIELTDHLRCLADHPEAFLVLLPDRMDGRDVIAGQLGCPVCGWTTTVVDGAVDFGGGDPTTSGTSLSPEAVHTLLGVSGPGGYVALAGGATAAAEALAAHLPGVRLVAVNPPARLGPAFPASVVRGGALPLKSRSLRGVVLGADLARDPAWVRDAIRATLPGLRVVGEGPAPELPEVDVLAEAGGVWVAKTH